VNVIHRKLQQQPAAASGLRFPRAAHLLKHSDFERVYREGQRHFARHLTVFYLPSPGQECARIGFTVSRAMGGAVQRNRIRRRLREAARLHRAELQAKVDVVVNAKRSLLQVNFQQLSDELAHAFQVVSARACSASPRQREQGTSQ
jgi:ribonuclease P protein component